MDREEFAKKLDEYYVTDAKQPMTRDERMLYVSESVAKINASERNYNFYGRESVPIIIEELAELIQELTKILRSRTRPDLTGLLEETADVKNAVEYIQFIFNISDGELERAQSVKMSSLVARLEEIEQEELERKGKENKK